MTRQPDREGWGQMGSEIDKHIDEEKLGLAPGLSKARGLEVKGCGLRR